ncbi:MAG: SIS domain-containing protein, partial [Lentisphaeraceae bacterium]|nr:SIS domain-containing protein [Lentisphaeraceae bacterium]
MNTFFELYFGVKKGGVNLLQTLRNLSVEQLGVFKNRIENCQGRVFFLGNGGSYDNARWMAQVLRKNGIMSKTPGEEEDYILTINSKGYSEIFIEALKLDGLSEKDLVVGISGSGNSENVLAAFDYAENQGAAVFALGGRDGGLMRSQIGTESCIIAENECMEAIEDIHNFAFTIVLEAIKQNKSVDEVKEDFVSYLREFMTEKNMSLLSDTAGHMVRTIRSNGSVFILGLGIGANHFRADM